MKFLILATCVCMAVAAPQRFGQAAGKAAAVAASPFVAAAKVTAQVVSAGARATQYAAGNDKAAEILVSESDVRPDGYAHKYETANGISAEANGQLKQIGDQAAVVSQGSYRYNAPDGTPVQITYIADENGYQPQSDLLPVAPEIPVAIARSLEYIAAHPYQEVRKL